MSKAMTRKIQKTFNKDEFMKYMHKEHEQLTAEEVIELLKETK